MQPEGKRVTQCQNAPSTGPQVFNISEPLVINVNVERVALDIHPNRILRRRPITNSLHTEAAARCTEIKISWRCPQPNTGEDFGTEC